MVGVRENSNLAAALSATKASFPDAQIVVIGDASKWDNVTAALELGATSFVDENMATSTLVKNLKTRGETLISVFILNTCSGTPPRRPAAKPGALMDPQGTGAVLRPKRPAKKQA